MKHIFVDFEMNPVSKQFKEVGKVCKNEIIEIGAVMLDDNLGEFESYKEYVKPECTTGIYARITALTGISQRMVAGAEKFEVAIEKFANWCCKYGEDFIVHAWSGSDLTQVTKEIEAKGIAITEKVSKMLNRWNDFQKDFCELVKAGSLLSLEKALSMAGCGFDGKMHDAFGDAKNTADLFTLSQDEEELLSTVQMIENEVHNTENASFTLGDIFNFGSFSPVLA